MGCNGTCLAKGGTVQQNKCSCGASSWTYITFLKPQECLAKGPASVQTGTSRPSSMADYGGGGGRRGGGRGGGGGYKRRREDEQHAPDSNRILLASLINLGDGSLPVRRAAARAISGKCRRAAAQQGKAQPCCTAGSLLQCLEVDEDTISSLTKLIRKEARGDANTVFSMLLDCAVQLSTKAPLYALVTGGCSALHCLPGGWGGWLGGRCLRARRWVHAPAVSCPFRALCCAVRVQACSTSTPPTLWTGCCSASRTTYPPACGPAATCARAAYCSGS